MSVVVKSSVSFSSFKLRPESFYCGSQHHCWHLHGRNPRGTSLRCRLRLGYSVLNLNKRTYRLCSCGGKEIEEHLFLNCTLPSALRVDLLQSVKSTSLKEGLQDLLKCIIRSSETVATSAVWTSFA